MAETFYKKVLQDNIHLILSNTIINDFPTIKKQFTSLYQDITSNVYNIVVLGEFKRGKSTFVNALLGNNILPTDILPETTTINAIEYNDTPKVTVYEREGKTSEYGDLSILPEYSAQNPNFDANTINYVKISYPSELLAKKIMIIDTPGVSDINQQRCEITYSFIPKANAVLFLLDASSPLKNTEVDFIETKLLSQGIDNIIFILNKFDLVDEEEDEDLLESTYHRIKKAFQDSHSKIDLENIKILPISALDALTGITTNNESLYNSSGLAEFKTELFNLLETGHVEKQTNKDFQRRYNQILRALIDELAQKKLLHESSIQELEKTSLELENIAKEKQSSKAKIDEYIGNSKAIIINMFNKSLEHFKEELINNITYEIETYNQGDFKTFIEGRITRVISKQSEIWFVKYGKNIDYLLKLLEAELSDGLSRFFSQRITLEAKLGKRIEAKSYDIILNSQDFSNDINMKSGLLAAGGAGILLLASSSLFMPLISFVAFPSIKKFMLDNKLKEAKAEIMPHVISEINRTISQIQDNVLGYIDEKIMLITNNTEFAFDNILADYNEKISKEIESKNDSKQNALEEVSNLETQITKLERLIEK